METISASWSGLTSQAKRQTAKDTGYANRDQVQKQFKAIEYVFTDDYYQLWTCVDGIISTGNGTFTNLSEWNLM